ncbi:MAG TPA: CHAT domain-containing protein [Microbacterium sp.]|nr:CHAT domain-containing protein [Microbacterium sp.]
MSFPANDEAAWRLIRDAENQIAEIDSLVDTARLASRLRLHVARSLGKLSRTSDGESAAEARFRSVGLYLATIRDPASTTTARDRYWAEGELAALYLDAGRTAEALRLARGALGSASSADDVLARYRFGRVLALALDGAGDRPASLDTLRRTARLGESLRRDRLGRLSSTDAHAPYAGEPDYRETTRLLLSMLLDEVESKGVTVSQSHLREVRDLLETQRSAELEDHFGDACLVKEEGTSIDAIEGALILYPILLEDRVALLTGFEGRFSYYRAPITTASVLDHTRELRRLLGKRTTRQYLRPAQHLYDALIRPIEGRIEAKDVEALIIVPEGLLRTIPFAALHDRQSKRFLIDLKPLALVPSLRLTSPTPIAREGLSILAAGIEQARGGFERLDYTRLEIESLRERFPSTRVLFDEAFKIDELEREIRTRPYSIVHVATHGRVEADGAKSFLLAHDGTLGLDRMSRMISTTRFRRDRPLELLTLSACETAAGDERAALGLAGVALRAGARSALATLWPVNDEATALLIDTFYGELFKPGQSRAGALRIAQREVRDTPRFAHPGYWAPFLMISSWL